MRENIQEYFSNIFPQTCALNIEKSIFNNAIDIASKYNITCSWNTPIFIHIYNTISNKIKSYVQQQHIYDKIINKEILSKNVGYLKKEDVYPDTYSLQNLLQQDEVQEEGVFQCNKCGSKKTTYYSLQTRSADEPMTNFITCCNCKNRWKM